MAAASFYPATASTQTGATAAVSSFSSDLLGSTGAEITPANFAALEKKHRVQLLIAGGWTHLKCQQEKEQIEREIELRSLQSDVIIAGDINPVEPLYGAFDLLLNTSDFEGLSISCIEAQRYGCPIVASKVGGQSESLDPDCLVSPANNISGYIEKIQVLIEQPIRTPLPLKPNQHLAPSLWWLLSEFVTLTRPLRQSPKTLFIINNLNLAGAQRSLTNLLTHPQFKHDCEVCVLDESLSNTHLERLRTAGIQVWQLEARRSLTQRVEQMIDLIRHTEVTQICFWNVAPKYKLLLSKLLADSPIHLFDVSAGSMFFEELEFAAEFQQRISWTQENHLGSLQQLVVKYQDGTPPKSSPVVTQVIHNGVDCAQFEEEFESPLPLGINPEFAIGTCSRITPIKRIDWLIDVMQILGESLPEATLTIVGKAHPKEQDYWDALQAKLNLAKYKNVYLVGESSDVRPYLQHFRVFALISEPGGCPNASLEAMAAGLPIVATRFGGALDQIHPGVNGFLVDRTNPQDMATALKCTLAHPTIRLTMGHNARSIARRKFSMEQMVDRYLNVLGKTPNPKSLL